VIQLGSRNRAGWGVWSLAGDRRPTLGIFDVLIPLAVDIAKSGYEIYRARESEKDAEDRREEAERRAQEAVARAAAAEKKAREAEAAEKAAAAAEAKVTAAAPLGIPTEYLLIGGGVLVATVIVVLAVA
jgi:septal ring-binding cell division protein DamX